MVGVLAVAHGAMAMSVGAFGCAFCIGPLYPMVLARSLHLRGKNLVFFSAGSGSAILPWLVGRTSAWSGSLREAMVVPACGALLLLVVLILDGRQPESRALRSIAG
jgi:fucose permease